MNHAITVEELSFRYPGACHPALDGLGFSVERGEVFGFLGPSGAGKSTAQKILIRLLLGFSGRADVLGRPVGQWGQELFERVGVAFEFPNHFEKLTGLENLRYFSQLFEGPASSAETLLEALGLSAAASERVGAYSKGMKTRLGVARALINQPELIFLDEPTGGLDPVSARSVMSIVREQRNQGNTVFLTTHDMHLADQVCDRVAFIVDGQIRIIGAPRDLKLEHGKATVRVEYRVGERLASDEFAADGLGEDAAFIERLRSGVETIHSQEASLEDVFVKVTGRALS